MTFDPVLLQRDGFAHVVGHVAEDLGEADLEAVLTLTGALADEDRALGLLDDAGRGHPVQRFVRAGIVVDEDRAVGLEDEEPSGFRQRRVQATRVANLAARDDQAHGRRPYCPFRTELASPAGPARRSSTAGPRPTGLLRSTRTRAAVFPRGRAARSGRWRHRSRRRGRGRRATPTPTR